VDTFALSVDRILPRKRGRSAPPQMFGRLLAIAALAGVTACAPSNETTPAAATSTTASPPQLSVLLQQTLLEFFLALDAVTGPRNGFKPLRIDLIAAVDAFAKGTFANAAQRGLHHLQRLPLIAALVEEKLFRIGTGGAIGDVLCGVHVGCATVLLIARNVLTKFALALFQSFLKCV